MIVQSDCLQSDLLFNLTESKSDLLFNLIGHRSPTSKVEELTSQSLLADSSRRAN